MLSLHLSAVIPFLALLSNLNIAAEQKGTFSQSMLFTETAIECNIIVQVLDYTRDRMSYKMPVLDCDR